MKINCIVIKDQHGSAEKIQKYINKSPELNLIKIVDTPAEALKIVEKNRINLVLSGIREHPFNQEFFFADVNGKRLKINFKDIAYVEGAGNYVLLVGKTWKAMIYKSMNAMQQLLGASHFIRIHKSFIISTECIESIKGNKCMILCNDDKKLLPIGGAFKENLLKELRIFS